MAAIDIPERQGVPPETTDTNPHRQLSQNPSQALYDALAEQMFSVPDAVEQPSQISIPGARALVLTEGVESGPQTVFMIDREFCHLHPPEVAASTCTCRRIPPNWPGRGAGQNCILSLARV